MQQVLFKVPIGDGLPVYGFGVMLFLAFIACIWLASRRAEKVGISREVIQDLAIWVFLGGILGARITYLMMDPPAGGIGAFIAAIPQIWTGGIIFYGAVIGATLSYFLGWFITFRYRPNVTTLRIVDIVAPTIAVGLLLGRVGCLLNGCCYGQVACTTCPAVHFPLSAPARYDLTAAGYQTAAGFLPEQGIARVLRVEPGSAAEEKGGLQPGDLIVEVNGRAVPRIKGEELPSTAGLAELLSPQEWPRGESELKLTVERNGKKMSLPPFQPRTIGVQPTQVYESISMFLVLLLLLAFDGVKRRDGQVMGLMMICYGIHRYINEILRIDQRPVGFESYVSLLLVAAGIGMMLWVSLRKQQPGAAIPAGAAVKLGTA